MPQYSNASTATLTGSDGRYFFGALSPATYCVTINATSPENQALLLPGDWTFPAVSVGYHQVTLVANETAFPVNLGWDYQLT